MRTRLMYFALAASALASCGDAPVSSSCPEGSYATSSGACFSVPCLPDEGAVVEDGGIACHPFGGPAKVVEKRVYVCADGSIRPRAGACPTTQPPEEVIFYVCLSTGAEVFSEKECPDVTITCPDGLSPNMDRETGHASCAYDVTCDEGWLFDTATATCKRRCERGETLAADGRSCEPLVNPPPGIVAVGDASPDEDTVTQSYPGGLFQFLRLSVRAGDRNVRVARIDLDVVQDVAPFDGTNVWEASSSLLRDRIGACYVSYAGPTTPPGQASGRRPAAEEGRTVLSFADQPFVLHGSGELGVFCWTNANVGAPNFLLAASLRSIDLRDADTGEVPEIAYGATNASHHDYAFIRIPQMPQAARTDDSPAGTVSPSFANTLAFRVVNPAAPAGHDALLTSVRYRLTHDGWYGGTEAVRTTDAALPDAALFADVTRTAISPTVSVINMAGNGGTLANGTERVFRFAMDATRAVPGNVLRVEILRFCYTDLVMAQGFCVNGDPLVAGKDLSF